MDRWQKQQCDQAQRLLELASRLEHETEKAVTSEQWAQRSADRDLVHDAAITLRIDAHSTFLATFVTVGPIQQCPRCGAGLQRRDPMVFFKRSV